jgi:hypothetical protein
MRLLFKAAQPGGATLTATWPFFTNYKYVKHSLENCIKDRDRDRDRDCRPLSAREAWFDCDDFAFIYALDSLLPHWLQERQRRVQDLLLSREDAEPA